MPCRSLLRGLAITVPVPLAATSATARPQSAAGQTAAGHSAAGQTAGGQAPSTGAATSGAAIRLAATLSPAQARALSKNVTDKVTVVLKDQVASLPDPAVSQVVPDLPIPVAGSSLVPGGLTYSVLAGSYPEGSDLAAFGYRYPIR